MRALVVRQPWASLIEAGIKTVELRSWPTSYRGPILICAGSQLWRGARHEHPTNGPRGVTLCTVDLVDCRPATVDDERAAGIEGLGLSLAGQYAWCLTDVRPVQRVPTKGRLGLYCVEEDLA